MTEEIFGAGDKYKDQTMVKTCDRCGRKYHPRNNSYQLTSRYCNQDCARGPRRPPAAAR